MVVKHLLFDLLRSMKAYGMKKILIIAASTLAVGAICYWGLTVLIATQGVELSIHGKIAMAIGVVFTFAIGIGLMSLVFYSNKHGHDETVYLSTDDVDADKTDH